MADQIDPEQIRRANEAVELLTNALGKSKTAEEKKLEAYERFGKQLGKSAADLGSSLYKGEKGVGQFGNAVESGTKALELLVLAIPGIGLAMKVLAVGLALLGKGINAAAKQGDALYKTYQDLGRAGATASDGISGVFRNMQNLGYGIEELDKMVALVTQNSETLAKFSMSAADGTNAFAEGMARIQRDGGLRLLGKTTDDINSAGAAFIRQQVAMGRRQNDVQGQLGDRTKAYVLELDRLQRLTGTSADALQKQQDELMSEDAYNVYMEMLESQGEAGKEQAAKIRATTALFPQYAKEIAQAIGGNVEAQGKLMFLMPNLIKDLRDPVKSFSDTAETAGKDLETVGKVFKPSFLLAADATRDFIGSVKDMNQAQASATDIKAREKAAAQGAKVQDTATQALTEAQIANMNSRDAMQAFIQRGVAPATIALAALAKGASALAGGAAGAVGAPTGGAAAAGAGGGGGAGGGAGGGGAGGGSYIDQIDSGIKGPSLLRRFGMAIGAVGAGPGAGLTGKDISGLSPGLAQALQQAAAEYNQITGKTVEVTSAVRDSAKQAELYQAYVSGKSKFPAAPPGSSKHERGLAVDISQAVADDMDRMGLLKKYGLSRPVANDPVHLEVSAANGAILSGPMSGYRPNLTMHGTEAIVPLNSPAAQSAFGSSDQTNLMSAQLDKLDELVRVMQNQVSVSTKILQAAA
jgi:D-alanyl-D-alanine dipeptidase